jgi:hypothetical protein
MRYISRVFLAIVTLMSLLNPALAVTHSPCGSIDNRKIEAAVKNFLDTHDTIHYAEIVVISKQCVNDYARAVIHPKKPTTDDATIYLKKTKSQWAVINYGTDFNADFMATIPNALKK